LTGVFEALRSKAESLHRQNRTPEAIAAYQRLLEQQPQLGECWFNLAVLQRQARQLTEALDSYRRALAADVPRPWEAHLNRSVIYTDYLREHALAEVELRQALELNPAFTPALLNLANLCEDLGRRDEASGHYARILELDPRSFEALARYANLQAPTSVEPKLIARLKAALDDRMASDAERASLGFALGRLLDASGDYAAAFTAYADANQASRVSVAPHHRPYDRARQQAFVDRIIDHGTAPMPAPDTGDGRADPIFICGMFRSGSTLAEQLLASIPGVGAGGELDFLPRLVAGELAPYPESLATLNPGYLQAIAARYRAELARAAPGARYVIDKRPDNFLYLGLIKSLLPTAKIIHTTRNPLDNCLSIFFLHLDQRMSYALRLMDIGHYYREYRRLMAHWKTLYAADIHDFDYDALVRDPQPALHRLSVFLGLEWGGRVPQVAPPGRAIKTASVWQVREPLYRTSSGRATHYARELRELHGYLSEFLSVRPAEA
jgi:tetratricopeptide (TPR) repeat protein